ncbi:MAG: hypothetical protein NXH85_13815 [Pseudomonadaceae bacterium]|nr:hypothetical protein [Pseudomonadaceae bacterium]
MAVYEHNDGKLLRVARSVGGQVRQQYFALSGHKPAEKKRLRKQAEALDAQWAQEQREQRQTRFRRAAASDDHSTGVRGINIVYRPAPAFRLQIVLDGKPFVREFALRRHGADKAWRNACAALARARGFARTPSAWLKKQPEIDAE